jgi:hypothetical protein
MYWTTHRDLAFTETLQPRGEIVEIIFAVAVMVVIFGFIHFAAKWINKEHKFPQYDPAADDEVVLRGPNDTEIIPPEVAAQAQKEAMQRSFDDAWTPNAWVSPSAPQESYYKVKVTRGTPLPEIPQTSRPVTAGEEEIKF